MASGIAILGGFAITGVVMVLIAALAGSRVGAQIGLFLAIALLPLPLVVFGVTNQRALLAFVISVCLARAIDFAVGPVPVDFRARLAYSLALLALVDTVPASSRARTFDRRSAAKLAIAAAVVLGGAAVWAMSVDLPASQRSVVRSLDAVAIFLGLAEAQTSFVALVTGIGGVTLRPVHVDPYRSRTVTEFWSRRWNLSTARWLRRHCFLPLSRRGAAFALFATFAASAALHVYLILVTADVGLALSWAAFFLAQPVLILAERQLQVRRWPHVAGRAWTLTTLMILSPLLFGPLLRLLNTSL